MKKITKIGVLYKDKDWCEEVYKTIVARNIRYHIVISTLKDNNLPSELKVYSEDVDIRFYFYNADEECDKSLFVYFVQEGLEDYVDKLNIKTIVKYITKDCELIC